MYMYMRVWPVVYGSWISMVFYLCLRTLPLTDWQGTQWVG